MIEPKKQTKQTRRTETESWIWRVGFCWGFLWFPDGRGVWGNSDLVRGLIRSTKR